MKLGDIYLRKRERHLAVITGLTDTHVIYSKTNSGKRYGRNCKRMVATVLRDYDAVDMAIFNKPEIEVTDFEWCDVHSDAGRYGLEFKCPICGGRLTYAEYGWWGMSCDCREWRVEIKATGHKRELEA